MTKFKDVICCIKNGGTARRMSWAEDGDKEIMMQIPQRISKDIVPKMTSVQESIKPKLSTVGSGEIEYHDQVIIITFTDDGMTPARATYYVPHGRTSLQRIGWKPKMLIMLECVKNWRNWSKRTTTLFGFSRPQNLPI